MTRPAAVLEQLATQLRDERTVISDHVTAPPADERPALGELAAAGPRTAATPDEYALVVEAVREGYLLHYARGRIVSGADPDLALLAGDYLYALGLERLGNVGDLHAVRELSDLITLVAQVHDAEPNGGGGERAEAKALWLACVTAIAAGASGAHAEAKRAAARRAPNAADALFAAAVASAAEAGFGDDLKVASRSIDFRPDTPS